MKGNFIVYLFGNSLNSLIPFILIPVITRYLTPSEYAVIGIFMALSSLFSAFAGLGLQSAVRVNFFKRKRADFNLYVSNILILSILSSSVTLTVVATLSPHIAGMLGISEKIIVLSVVFAISQYITQIVLVLFQVEEKALKYALLQTTQIILNFSISILLLIYIEQGYEGRINGILYSSIVVSVLSIFLLKKRGFSIFSYSEKHIKSALNFGLPLIPHIFIISLIPIVDRFILANQVTLESAGLYFFAFQLALPIKILSISINLAFMPWCYRNMRKKNEGIIVVVTYAIMFMILTSSVLYVLLLNTLLPYLAPEGYHSPPELLYTLVTANIFHGFYLLTVKSFTYTEKVRKLSLITIPFGIIYIIVIYLTANEFKELGVAFASMFHAFFVFIFTWFFAGRIYPQPWFNVNVIKKFSIELISSKLYSKK